MKKKGNFKQLAFVLTASMMLALFAACGSKTTEASPEASDSGSARWFFAAELSRQWTMNAARFPLLR